MGMPGHERYRERLRDRLKAVTRPRPQSLADFLKQPKARSRIPWGAIFFYPVLIVGCLGLTWQNWRHHNQSFVDWLTFTRQPAVAFPANGSVQYFFDSRIGYLEAFTISATKNLPGARLVVHFRDWNTGALLVSLYTVGSASWVLTIPQGTYRVSIASGEDWIGGSNLFGDDTRTWQIREPFTVVPIPGQRITQSIDLMPAFFGNLSRTGIPRNQF